MDIHKIKNSTTASVNNVETNLPGFWIRLSAFIIDFVCILLPCFYLFIIIDFFTDYQHTSFCIFIFIIFSYHTLTIGKWGQTLGKFSAGILVVRKDGKKLTYLRAFIRTLVWYIVMFLLLLSFLFTIDSPLCLHTESLCIVFVLTILCLLGSILHHRIFFYDYICKTKVIYKKTIGKLRKSLVVIFGIGSLIAINYISRIPSGTTPEKSRIAEAKSLIAAVKSAQERFLAKTGEYATEFTQLDIHYPGITSTHIPLKFYVATMNTEKCVNKPCYVLTLTRHTNNTAVASKYGLYSLSVTIPDKPQVMIAGCPGGKTNCDELLE